MGNIRRAHTKPELVVRRMLHALGYRYRLQWKAVPGRPDIAFTFDPSSVETDVKRMGKFVAYYIDMQNSRVRAIFKRVEAGKRKRRDKFARSLEALSKSATPALRRMPQRDRDYVDLVGKAEKEGWLGDVPLVLSKLKKKLGTYRLPH